MNLPASSDALLRELAVTQAELERLDKQNAQLQTALEEIEHDSRRCNDSLERAGWHSAQAEARGAMLAECRREILRDQEKNRALHVQLTERLARIRTCLHEDGHDG